MLKRKAAQLQAPESSVFYSSKTSFTARRLETIFSIKAVTPKNRMNCVWQPVQNATDALCWAGHYGHITALLTSLCWLPFGWGGTTSGGWWSFLVSRFYLDISTAPLSENKSTWQMLTNSSSKHPCEERRIYISTYKGGAECPVQESTTAALNKGGFECMLKACLN